MGKFLSVLLFILCNTSCIVFPWETVLPVESKVIDDQTGKELVNINYLRIVIDVHDFGCNKPYLEEGVIEKGLEFHLDNKREWGVYLPVPGGLPVPMHYIAIWKEGYHAVVFSPYDLNDEKLSQECSNHENIKYALEKIPKPRTFITQPFDINEKLLGGTIKLVPIEHKE